MKKCMTVLVLLCLVFAATACGVAPKETTPEATTPEATTPEVTTPEITTPEMTTPAVTDPEYFVFIEEANGYALTGVTAEGKAQTALIVPRTYNDKPVISIETNAFAGCTVLEKLTLLDSLETINEGAFSGCSALTEMYLYFVASDSGDIATLIPTYQDDLEMFEQGFLLGVNENVKLYVPSDVFADFLGCYFFGNYASIIEVIPAD